MTQRIYISFLGVGDYQNAVYEWNDHQDAPSPYAQVAELSLLSKYEAPFERIIVLGTSESRSVNWEPSEKNQGGLQAALVKAGLEASFIEISSELSAKQQWQTFEKLLDLVGEGDHLTIDMTHGFRAVPVVFSSAMHFLHLTRGVKLEHVLYAMWERDEPGPFPIIDYAEFYTVGDWTDAVSRLVDDADAGKLARLAFEGSGLPLLGKVEAEALAEAMQALTDAVRNVEVQSVAHKAQEALELVASAREQSQSGAGRSLLDLVLNKFGSLAETAPLTGRYDADYFAVQLALAELLLEHRLYMQAYTAMREMMASIGLRYRPKIRYSNKKGRDARARADVFYNMLQFSEHDPNPKKQWRFSGPSKIAVDKMLPWYRALEAAGLVAGLRAVSHKVSKLRNGFDHAWTSKQGPPAELAQESQATFAQLKVLVQQAADLEVPPEGRPAAAGTAFINLSNHPVKVWSTEQKEAALAFGYTELVELPDGMPQVDPDVDSNEVEKLARDIAQKAQNLGAGAAFVAGEFNLTYALVSILQGLNIPCYSATTRREVSEIIREDGRIEKTSVFHFVRWRAYSGE